MTETITLAGGCFWCLEAAFDAVQGVLKAESGYMGGDKADPTYEDVCAGNTGHAEVVQLTIDPESISIREILEIFFALHDPTQLNRQGGDIGTQYRTAIFYHSDDQKAQADSIIKEIDRSDMWADPVVTQVEARSQFYPAGQYHQDYVSRNRQNEYCQVVVSPKLAKFKKTFAAKLKTRSA